MRGASVNLDRDYEARFIARWVEKVDKSAGFGKCWQWLGARNKNGYGTLRGGRCHISETGIRWVYQAHRVALAIDTCPREFTIFTWMDEEQARLEAAHLCHQRSCQNPQHLVWKTHRQNVSDIIDRYGRLGLPAHDKGRRISA